jgi:hypothetical protein
MSNLVHGMMCVLLETGLVLFDMSDHCMYFCGKQQLTLTSGVLDCNSKVVFYSSLTLLCNGQSFKILPHSLVAPPSFLVYNKFHISFDL